MVVKLLSTPFPNVKQISGDISRHRFVGIRGWRHEGLTGIPPERSQPPSGGSVGNPFTGGRKEVTLAMWGDCFSFSQLLHKHLCLIEDI